MGNYKLQNGVQRGDLSLKLSITALIVVGMVVGGCMGLYVAVKTLPLPHETVYYISR